MYDNADHDKIYWGGQDFNVHFKVENDKKADQLPPNLKKVEVEKQTYKAGDIVRVSVEAEDDVSGVMGGFVIVRGTTGEESTARISYDKESNKWIADIQLNPYANPGEYKIASITLYDNADHSKIYWGGQDFNLFFNVTKS